MSSSQLPTEQNLYFATKVSYFVYISLMTISVEQSTAADMQLLDNCCNSAAVQGGPN